ncbi:hypothetical protein [Candidatus Laterigemmans baculatus]|uniref:hypothetical protein n=1 Tax=Candidatus Laterigemmans baculatus TaxID=2770505 RepID=UPI0013D8FE3C|nr:hypothetical protein [Candidatus Laterigemmans baculatus]
MYPFPFPSFAFLTSLLLVLPPSGCGDWLRPESTASSSAQTPVRSCCGSAAAPASSVREHSRPASPVFGCHASGAHSDAPCAPLQSVCDCCDAAEATVPLRTNAPDTEASFVASTADLSMDHAAEISSPSREPIATPVRLHILKCVWRC